MLLIKVCPGLVILAVSQDLAENYQRTKLGFPWLILPHGIVIMTAFDKGSFPLAASSLGPSAKPGIKEAEGCCLVTAQEGSPPASFLEVPGRKFYLCNTL